MAKSELKTQKTEVSVEDFFDGITVETVRDDCRKLAEMMEKATGAKAKMWGANIVAFGKQRLKYASGKEMDWIIVGFSPRKQNITLYLSTGEVWNKDLLLNLGKHKIGAGCLYIKRLSDIDESILNELIKESAERAKK